MMYWMKKNKWIFIGALAGAIAGFVYWKFVGCVSGTCAITSNPVRSTIYFGVLGAFLFSAITTNKKEEIKS